jgi:hypothetical protein
VKRGTIKGFTEGVTALGFATLSEVRLVSNERGAFSEVGSVTLTNSVAAHNGTGVAATNGQLQILHSSVINNGVGVEGVQLGLTIRDSLISGNDRDGVHSLDQVVTVTNSVVSGNGGYGMWIIGQGADQRAATLIGNIASRNGADGILLGVIVAFPPNPWYVAHNTANQNHGYGIDIDNLLGQIVDYDKGGNVARGNGQPAQCVNIVCSSN